MGNLFERLLAAGDAYSRTRDAAGGDPREAYNRTESARAGRDVPELAGVSPEDLAAVNRVADTADPVAGGFNSVALPAYEGLKYLEMKTPIKALSMLKAAGVPRVTLPNERTTQPSLYNAASSALGPALGNDRVRAFLRGLTGRR